MPVPGEAIVWIVVIIAALIFAPLIAHAIRKRDFKRQVQGKKSERKLKENDPALYSGKEEFNTDAEILKTEAWMKSKQNFFGPKGPV